MDDLVEAMAKTRYLCVEGGSPCVCAQLQAGHVPYHPRAVQRLGLLAAMQCSRPRPCESATMVRCAKEGEQKTVVCMLGGAIVACSGLSDTFDYLRSHYNPGEADIDPTEWKATRWTLVIFESRGQVMSHIDLGERV